MSEKNISKVPSITPELLAQNEEDQKIWRKLFSAPVISTDKYAESVIRDLLCTLDTLEAQLRAAKYGEHLALKQKIRKVRNDAALWMVSVGKFAEAEKLTLKPEQKKLYRDYARAVKRADGDWCGHPNWIEAESGETQQNVYREFQFFSPIHGRRVSMVRCGLCGFRNARDISPDLQKLSDHRAASRKAAENTPRENLAAKLKAEGLGETNLAKIIK